MFDVLIDLRQLVLNDLSLAAGQLLAFFGQYVFLRVLHLVQYNIFEGLVLDGEVLQDGLNVF